MTDSGQGKGAATATASRTRERLLIAARDLFNTEGYFGTDTNKIARAAGFAPATFYKHFRDKREVFIEVYREWVLSEWSMLRPQIHEGGDAESLTRSRLSLVRKHHCRWAGFRRSLRALINTDEEIQAVRLEQRELQLSFLGELRAAQGLPRMERQQLLFVLYTVERVCDAIADGEVGVLGVGEEDLFDELVRWTVKYDSTPGQG